LGAKKKDGEWMEKEVGRGGGVSALSTPYEEECKQTVGLITNYVE
jgi:hypothetical protein